MCQLDANMYQYLSMLVLSQISEIVSLIGRHVGNHGENQFVWRMPDNG